VLKVFEDQWDRPTWLYDHRVHKALHLPLVAVPIAKASLAQVLTRGLPLLPPLDVQSALREYMFLDLYLARQAVEVDVLQAN